MRFKLMMHFTALSLIALLASGCGEKKVEKAPEVVRPVKTYKVAAASGLDRTYPGKVKGSETVNISFRVSGPLLELPAKEGDKVLKGDLLAKIDSRDYDIDLTKAKAEFNKADADYQRYQKLYEKDAVALADLDLYRSQRAVKKAKLEDAIAAVQDTTLRAPFDGQIGSVFVDNFQEVTVKQDILSIYDAKNIEVIIDLPEKVVARYKEGDKVLAFAAFEVAPDKRFKLAVKEFSTQADPTTQTYQATLSMPSPKDINILPGMTASVELKDTHSKAAGNQKLSIPGVAVFPGDSGESFVWVVNQESMMVTKRQIKVGSLVGTADIEVVEGIGNGDLIVIAGIKQLREGMQVKLLK